MILAQAIQLQNRFAPLPAKLHIIFALIATALLLVIYFRTKKISNILWALTLDATVILQFFYDPTTALAVGICEIMLIGLLIWQTYKEKKQDALLAEQAKSEAEVTEQEIEELDKLVKSERKAIMDDNKIDVIGDAFDGEDTVK